MLTQLGEQKLQQGGLDHQFHPSRCTKLYPPGTILGWNWVLDGTIDKPYWPTICPKVRSCYDNVTSLKFVLQCFTYSVSNYVYFYYIICSKYITQQTLGFFPQVKQESCEKTHTHTPKFFPWGFARPSGQSCRSLKPSFSGRDQHRNLFGMSAGGLKQKNISSH